LKLFIYLFKHIFSHYFGDYVDSLSFDETISYISNNSQLYMNNDKLYISCDYILELVDILFPSN